MHRSYDRQRLLELRFTTKNVVIVLSKTMSFIANVLQQPQGKGVTTEDQGLSASRAKDLFVLLGKRKHHRRVDPKRFKRSHRAAQLAFATIDQKNIGEGVLLIIKSLKPTGNDFRLNRRETTS